MICLRCGNFECFDEEITEFDDDEEIFYRCICCGAEGNEIVNPSLEDQLDLECRHRDVNGEWHRKEIPEKDRSVRLREKLFLERI